ncbi:MAG: hypothetical protein NZ898_02690 [Myxococcota bacterium]|nr:hypothetical protein [Myxococcota bacterium]MDW8361280.1 hypothetical protein [Myxococcales bacterium]
MELDERTLQRLHDDDLPPAQAAAVRALLEREPGLRRHRERLERLGAMVRLAVEDRVGAVDVEAAFEGLRARLARAGTDGGVREAVAPELGARSSGSRPALRALGADADVGRDVGKAGRPSRVSVLLPPVEPWKVWIPVAFAAAAAAMLALLWAGASRAPGGRHEAQGAVDAQGPPQTTALHIEPPMGSQVEEVDFGQNAGSVFEVEGDAGEPIAVVWIVDARTMDEVMR